MYKWWIKWINFTLCVFITIPFISWTKKIASTFQIKSLSGFGKTKGSDLKCIRQLRWSPYSRMTLIPSLWSTFVLVFNNRWPPPVFLWCLYISPRHQSMGWNNLTRTRFICFYNYASLIKRNILYSTCKSAKMGKTWNFFFLGSSSRIGKTSRSGGR